MEEEDFKSEKKVIFITKDIRVPSNLPIFDSNFYLWKKSFWKEKIKLIKNVVAPMVDQSELAFRMLMRHHNAHLCYTPMIHANLFVNDFTYRKTAFSTIPSDRPLIVQFCANNPHILLEACRLVEGFCDGVDLNLGCPQLIAKRGRYGSYLEEYPDLIKSMIELVYKHSRLPISVKIRIRKSLSETISYAKMIEDAGASMLTVHGRVREQRGVHTGLADWNPIRELKNVLNIPIIANGNIQVSEDIERCLLITGADAVMSAEGVLNNPLLFSKEHKNVFDVAREYLNYAKRYNAIVSAIRAHIFRICHYSLIRHSDLREKTSCVFLISDFNKIIDELEIRCLREEFNIMEDEATDKFKKKKFEMLSFNESLRLKIDDYNKKFCDYETNENKYKNLYILVHSLPYWICKPYLRPLQMQVNNVNKNFLNEINSITNNENKVFGQTNYRIERKAEIDRISAETGLSKRQIRRRERRRVEKKRKNCIKQNCLKCEKCQQPAGLNCNNLLCKRCCKTACIRFALDCKIHRFFYIKLQEKRKNYASRIGITMEELLERETIEIEKIKFYKNGKKPILKLNNISKTL